MNTGAPAETTNIRRVFFLLSVIVMIATLGGIIALTVMENQARAALPPHEQSPEAIASIYDGAVCLGCDYGKIFVVMFGPLAFLGVLVSWGIYEIGRHIMISWAPPK